MPKNMWLIFLYCILFLTANIQEKPNQTTLNQNKTKQKTKKTKTKKQKKTKTKKKNHNKTKQPKKKTPNEQTNKNQIFKHAYIHQKQYFNYTHTTTLPGRNFP